MQNPTYQNVLDAYNNLQTLSPKEKYKKIRSVAALAKEALKSCVNPDELKFYATIFKQADESRLLNLAKSKELELKGITEIKTLKTKLGAVEIESGVIAVGDRKLGFTAEYDTTLVLEKVREGNFYCVDTGGDGTFDVILRLVDIEEPLLGPKEYRFVINNSKTSVIKISSGDIKCSDLYDLAHQDVPGVSYPIENGFYKVAFYLKEIEDKFFGFVVVLAKSKTLETSDIDTIEQLG